MSINLEPATSNERAASNAGAGTAASSTEAPPATRRGALLGMTAAVTAAFLADQALLAPDSARAAEPVESVNGQTGKVVLTAADVSAVPATDLIMLPGENLAIGEGAFASFTSKSEAEHKKHRGNTAFGWHALHSLTGTEKTSTEDNTAVGSQALAFLTTGGGNTAIGENAGVNITTGEENVAIGCEALAAQQEANGNCVIGFRAGGSNTTGENLVALGYGAMTQNTTGNENVAVGNMSGHENKTGSRNTSVGSLALEKNTASENVAIGTNALRVNKTGAENTAVGTAALTVLETGKENVAIGRWSLVHLLAGNNNVALGTGAGQDCLGSGNVFLGNEAGAKETGSQKLYIANTETTEPLIHGVFPNEELTFNASKIALYKGVTPVARHATIAVPGETTAANTKAIKEIIEAIKAIGVIL